MVIDAVDHTRLHDDYAEICSFLSDQARVVTELQALNTAIRNKLEAADASGEVQGVRAKVEAVIGRTGGYDDPTRAVAQGEPARVFKTHKVLSGVLDEAEQAAGFNGAQAKLHTTAQTAGDGSNPFAFSSAAPGGMAASRTAQYSCGQSAPDEPARHRPDLDWHPSQEL